MLRVVDVSSWDSGCNIQSLRGYDALIVKATEGTDYVNPYYEKQARNALRTGKMLGFYHYLQENEPEKQARYFWQHVKPYKDAILICDYEDAETMTLGRSVAVRFLEELKKLSGIDGVIYCSQSRCNEFSEADANRYALWVAQYPPVPHPGFKDALTRSGSIYPWSTACMWQFCSDGRLSGYNGDLDLSNFYGDKAAWLALAGGKSEDVIIVEDEDYKITIEQK